MRTSILLFLLASPLLVASGAVLAKASSTDIGKPVCTHYDDSAKQASSSAADSAASNSAPATASAPTAAPAASVVKSGGTDSMTHPRQAPHWQTFLPGMYR
jgi:hypothetical protein